MGRYRTHYDVTVMMNQNPRREDVGMISMIQHPMKEGVGMISMNQHPRRGGLGVINVNRQPVKMIQERTALTVLYMRLIIVYG